MNGTLRFSTRAPLTLVAPGPSAGACLRGDRRIRTALVLAILWWPVTGAPVQAQRPWVQFDVPARVGCRDVTPPEFEAANPDERLVEAKLQISSLIRDGHEDDLLQYLYRIESPERTLQIADYLPKTTLATNIVGNLGVETKLEKSSSIGITAAGHYDHVVDGDATAARSSKSTSSVRYELLPRLDLLASAGTMSRGTGVYFKLRPSDRTSLEGAKDFALVLRVPRPWRGDYVRVVCESKCHKRTLVGRSAVTSGDASFVVALYDEKDPLAKAAATQLVLAEQRLLNLARTQRHAIEQRRHATLGHELAASFSLVDPKIPPTWLSDVYQRTSGSTTSTFEKHLPPPVRQAASEYTAAKRTLHRLCGQPGPVDERL